MKRCGRPSEVNDKRNTIWCKRLSALTLVLAGLVFLAACAEGNGATNGINMRGGSTLEPTPTLLPGLPTNTPLPLSLVVDEVSGDVGQGAIPTPEIKPTSTPQPLRTLTPSEQLEAAFQNFTNENYQAAADQFQQVLTTGALNSEDQQNAQLFLGRSQLQMGQYGAAVETLGYLAASDVKEESSPPQTGEGISSSDELPAGQSAWIEPNREAYYFLGEAYRGDGNCAAAVSAYETFVESNPDLIAYVGTKIADCYLQLDDRDKGLAWLERASNGRSHAMISVPIHLRIAELYRQNGENEAAFNHYNSVLAIGESEKTLGQAAYQAGMLKLLSGAVDEGYDYYLRAVNNYPSAPESYLALIALIEAGYEVDEFMRGVVDFHADAFEPAIAAFQRYLADTNDPDDEAFIFLAKSYEGLGNIEAALATIDAFIDLNSTDSEQSEDIEVTEEPTASFESVDSAPTATVVTDSLTITTGPEVGPSSSETVKDQFKSAARGQIERAKLLVRTGDLDAAIADYETYMNLYPEEEDGPFAAWWAAAYRERLGQIAEAIDGYQRLAELYPDHEDASEALFRAGYLNWQNGDSESALADWERATTLYPDRDFGAAARIWQMRLLPPGESGKLVTDTLRIRGDGYYQIRARDAATGTLPFSKTGAPDLASMTDGKVSAERWLADRLGLDESIDVGELSPEIISDDRFIRGTKLWHLGEREAAKLELEALRETQAENPLLSYQLALAFRELGLYRSSILAATSVMRNLNVNAFEAPKFIVRLAYPAYYQDLVLMESERYDFDPLLQLALIRQESLFESFARSHAAAQGLSQVIPDTGAYIAQRLNWPNFENEDLYHPYVGIAFGAYYLALQLESFDGDVALALSAYNGGPGNAARWSADAADDIDLLVETVDFFETRQYIKRIYAGHAIYRYLYGDS